MAAPIASDFRVVGLLEIFSPHPRSFTKAHEAVLDRLVEMIPKIHTEKIHPEKTPPQEAEPEDVSDLSQPSVSEFGSIPAPRYAFHEPTPEIRAQISQPSSQ